MATYAGSFMDAVLWRPYVLEVCRLHALEAVAEQDITAGVSGSFPTFLVRQQFVVKFFGRLLDGEHCFAVEGEVDRLIGADRHIPNARIIARGNLFSDGDAWPWPYLVFEYLPGESIGAAWARTPFEEKLRVAGWLGGVVNRLHHLSTGGSALFPSTWDAYLAFLAEQRRGVVARQRAWGSLPALLIDQVEEYLCPPEDLLDPGPAHLIHADLTADHLLGSLVNGAWITSGIIDWGDAMSGSLYYELAALHLDLFHGERRLLAEFLNAYGLDESARRLLPRRAMSAALLHRFDVFAGFFIRLNIDRQAVRTLDELACLLWSTDGM